MRLALFLLFYPLSVVVVGSDASAARDLPPWVWPIILSALAFLGASVAAPLLRKLGAAAVAYTATTDSRVDDIAADALKNLCDGAAQALERGDTEGAAAMLAKANDILRTILNR